MPQPVQPKSLSSWEKVDDPLILQCISPFILFLWMPSGDKTRILKVKRHLQQQMDIIFYISNFRPPLYLKMTRKSSILPKKVTHFSWTNTNVFSGEILAKKNIR
jgi:hypothetical protein